MTEIINLNGVSETIRPETIRIATLRGWDGEGLAVSVGLGLGLEVAVGVGELDAAEAAPPSAKIDMLRPRMSEATVARIGEDISACLEGSRYGRPTESLTAKYTTSPWLHSRRLASAEFRPATDGDHTPAPHSATSTISEQLSRLPSH